MIRLAFLFLLCVLSSHCKLILLEFLKNLRVFHRCFHVCCEIKMATIVIFVLSLKFAFRRKDLIYVSIVMCSLFSNASIPLCVNTIL